MADVNEYFEVFPNAALHGYPVDEWRRVVWDFRQSRGAYGKPRPRLEAFCGPADYSYGTDGGLRSEWGRTPQGILSAATAHYSKLARADFNSCLAVLYRDGSDSVAWHADDERDMGETVLSVSYGATRRFSVRPKSNPREVVNFDLSHKDVLIMRPGAQVHFEHCLRKTSKPVGPRICMTFRELRC